MSQLYITIFWDLRHCPKQTETVINIDLILGRQV